MFQISLRSYVLIRKIYYIEHLGLKPESLKNVTKTEYFSVASAWWAIITTISHIPLLMLFFFLEYQVKNNGKDGDLEHSPAIQDHNTLWKILLTEKDEKV